MLRAAKQAATYQNLMVNLQMKAAGIAAAAMVSYGNSEQKGTTLHYRTSVDPLQADCGKLCHLEAASVWQVAQGKPASSSPR